MSDAEVIPMHSMDPDHAIRDFTGYVRAKEAELLLVKRRLEKANRKIAELESLLKEAV